MATMQDVFDAPDENPEVSQGEAQPNQQQALEPAEGQEAQATPPVADTDKHVPLAALEAVRNDYKGKAARLEGEMQAIRAERDRLLEAQRAGQPQGELDPIAEAQNRFMTMTLNQSERAAKKEHGAEVVDKAFERMQQEFTKNPALHRQIMTSVDPWDEVVQQGKRLMAMDEIGSDPVAYRKKVEDEIRASLQPGGAAPATSARVPLPTSLANARSAGSRGAVFTGPTPIESLFPN